MTTMTQFSETITNPKNNDVYKVKDNLGKGSQGQVKLVELDGSHLAIKEIHLTNNSNFEESVDDINDVIQKLKREQEFNKILDHTGIIRQ